IIAVGRRTGIDIGHVGINRSETIRGVDVARAVEQDVRAVQHIEGRQPGSAAVDGILDRRDVVLVLHVNVVEGQIDVGLAAQVVVTREEIIYLFGGRAVSYSNDEVGGNQVGDQGVVDDLVRSDIQSAKEVGPVI